MKIEVSNGEILDKLTILKIKLKNVKDEEKLKHVRNEHDFLENISMNIHYDTNLFEELLIINNKLWDIEDAIRNKEIMLLKRMMLFFIPKSPLFPDSPANTFFKNS